MREDTVIEYLLNLEWLGYDDIDDIILINDIKSELLNSVCESCIIYTGIPIVLYLNDSIDYTFNVNNIENKEILDYLNSITKIDITYYIKSYKRNYNISKL